MSKNLKLLIFSAAVYGGTFLFLFFVLTDKKPVAPLQKSAPAAVGAVKPSPSPVVAERLLLAQRFEEAIKNRDFKTALELLGSFKNIRERKSCEAKLADALELFASASLDKNDFVAYAGVLKTALSSRLSHAVKERVSKLGREHMERLFDSGKYGRYLALANEFRGCEDVDLATLKNMYSSCMFLERYDEAILLARAISEKSSDGDDSFVRLIDTLIAAKKFDEAKVLVGEKLAQDKFNFLYYKMSGRILSALGDYAAATEAYGQSAYYSNFNPEAIIEAGEFFIRHDKLENYTRLTSAKFEDGRIPFSSKVALAYVIAKAASKGGESDLSILGNVMDNAPTFVDAFFLYAEGMSRKGDLDSMEMAIAALKSVSSKFDDKNDYILLKLAQVAGANEETFKAEGKPLLEKLAVKYSDADYGALEARRKVLEYLRSLAASSRADSAEFKTLVNKIENAKTKDGESAK